MNIIDKIQELKQSFDNNLQEIEAKQRSIDLTNQEIQGIVDNQKKLEGAYGILVELGVEQGILNADGTVIPAQVTAEDLEKPIEVLTEA